MPSLPSLVHFQSQRQRREPGRLKLHLKKNGNILRGKFQSEGWLMVLQNMCVLQNFSQISGVLEYFWDTFSVGVSISFSKLRKA